MRGEQFLWRPNRTLASDTVLQLRADTATHLHEWFMPQLMKMQSFISMNVCYDPCQDSLAGLLCKPAQRHLPLLLPGMTAPKACS